MPTETVETWLCSAGLPGPAGAGAGAGAGGGASAASVRHGPSAPAPCLSFAGPGL